MGSDLSCFKTWFLESAGISACILIILPPYHKFCRKQVQYSHMGSRIWLYVYLNTKTEADFSEVIVSVSRILSFLYLLVPLTFSQEFLLNTICWQLPKFWSYHFPKNLPKNDTLVLLSLEFRLIYDSLYFSILISSSLHSPCNAFSLNSFSSLCLGLPIFVL